MCTGGEVALIASALASAGGTLISQQAGQRQAEKAAAARNQVLNNFLDKNQTLSEEARGLFEDRMQRQTAEEQTAQQGEAEAERSAATTQAIEPLFDPIPISGSAPRVVTEGAVQAGEESKGKALDMANALARARSFGDLLFENNMASNAAGRDIGVTQGFAQSNAQNLPNLQDLAEIKARSKGSGMATLGALLSAAGSAGSMASGAGVFGPAAASAAPATGSLSYLSRFPKAVGLGLG